MGIQNLYTIFRYSICLSCNWYDIKFLLSGTFPWHAENHKWLVEWHLIFLSFIVEFPYRLRPKMLQIWHLQFFSVNMGVVCLSSRNYDFWIVYSNTHKTLAFGNCYRKFSQVYNDFHSHFPYDWSRKTVYAANALLLPGNSACLPHEKNMTLSRNRFNINGV